MQRLSALVQKPRLHLICFHDVLEYNAKLHALVVPQEPEPAAQESPSFVCKPNCAHHCPVLMSWVKLLKRVFPLHQERCPNCGGELKIIAAILEQLVIERIRSHLGFAGQGTAPYADPWPGAASGVMLPSRNSAGDSGDHCP